MQDDLAVVCSYCQLRSFVNIDYYYYNHYVPILNSFQVHIVSAPHPIKTGTQHLTTTRKKIK